MRYEKPKQRMDKVFFFFTRLNRAFAEELKDKNFFTESRKIEVSGECDTEMIGFNYSNDARIAQLYFADGGVRYRYIQTHIEVIDPSYPLIFLICDNEYRKDTDALLDSLFMAFSENTTYCYFHHSNTTIKEKVLKDFGANIKKYSSFMHEKGQPFFELISLIDVDSQSAFETKIEEIQREYLGTDEEIKESDNLCTKLAFLHKILGQNYKLENSDQNEIEFFIHKNYTYDQSLEGLKQLRDHLLKQIN
jgi:hypothetical protein